MTLPFIVILLTIECDSTVQNEHATISVSYTHLDVYKRQNTILKVMTKLFAM